MNKDKISEYCLYLWLLALPWQTKLIFCGAPVNYLEISFFASWLLLIVFIILNLKKIRLNNWPLILFEGIALLSIFWAPDKLVAWYRFLILAAGGLLFFIIKKQKVVKAGQFFIAGLLAPAFLGIYQFFTQSTFANKYLGLAYHSAGTLGDVVIETNAGRFLRAYGSFDHPNILGGMMVLGLLLVLCLSLKKEIGRNARLFYLIDFSVLYSALLVSFSRTAILALILSAPFIIFYAWQRGLFQKKLIGLFIFLTIFISAAIVIPYYDLFLIRAQTTSRLENKSISERELYLKQAEGLIIKKPIQGFGLGNYTLAVAKADNYTNPYWYYQPVHNYWLLIWAELGVFGLIVILLFWFGVFKADLKNGLWPIVLALGVFSLLDHWLWTQNIGILVFFMIAGLLFREDI